jgi:hypothetical protein
VEPGDHGLEHEADLCPQCALEKKRRWIINLNGTPLDARVIDRAANPVQPIRRWLTQP